MEAMLDLKNDDDRTITVFMVNQLYYKIVIILTVMFTETFGIQLFDILQKINKKQFYIHHIYR